MKPELDAHGVKLVIIGVEELGVKTFIKSHYFSGGESDKLVTYSSYCSFERNDQKKLSQEFITTVGGAFKETFFNVFKVRKV